MHHHSHSKVWFWVFQEPVSPEKASNSSAQELRHLRLGQSWNLHIRVAVSLLTCFTMTPCPLGCASTASQSGLHWTGGSWRRCENALTLSTLMVLASSLLRSFKRFLRYLQICFASLQPCAFLCAANRLALGIAGTLHFVLTGAREPCLSASSGKCAGRCQAPRVKGNGVS